MTLPLVLDWTLRGSVLVALAAGGVALLRRSTAAHRHLVWTLALGGVLVLPLLSFALPWRLPVIPGLASAPVAITPAADESPMTSQAVGRGSSAASPNAPASTTPSAASSSVTPSAVASVQWSAPRAADVAPVRSSGGTFAMLLGVLRAMWIVGIALAIGRVVIGVLALRWITRDARAVSDRGWLELLSSTCERLDLGVPVQLLESPHANMPMAFGLRRPIVMLPMENDTWSAERREVVLLHELAHIRRMDVRANLVGQLACALYWFNPLVWVAARRLRIEAERACDDLVLGAGAGASAYAGHLLDMVQSAASLRAPAFAVPMAQPSAFEGRVLAILDPKVARQGVTRRATLFGVLALFAIAVPLAALAPRQDQHEERDRQREVRRAERDAQRELQRARTLENQITVQTTNQVQVQTDVAVRAELEATRTMNIREHDLERMSEQAARVSAQAVRERELTAERAQRQASDPRVIQGLVVALGDSDEQVRLMAAHALGAREDTAAVNALLNALRRDASKDVRKTAAWALGQIEDARSVQGLLAALQAERDTEVRNTIVWALGQIESKDAVQGLGAALGRETDDEVRRTIVWAFGQIESADAVPFLATVTRDGDVELRSKVAWAFGQIVNASAIEPLTAMYNAERVSSVREQIVWALGQIEDARAVGILENALRDTSLAVRRKAAWAMGQLDGLHAMPAGLIAAIRDPDIEVRRSAVRAAGELEDSTAVPALIQALHDDDLEVRRGAIRALGDIPGTQSVEALVAALHDNDAEIRRLAAQALGNR
jgi:HEAT repeat protein/beta-lactamase regulating signal transducer with metallopeptidase domain